MHVNGNSLQEPQYKVILEFHDKHGHLPSPRELSIHLREEFLLEKVGQDDKNTEEQDNDVLLYIPPPAIESVYSKKLRFERFDNDSGITDETTGTSQTTNQEIEIRQPAKKKRMATLSKFKFWSCGLCTHTHAANEPTLSRSMLYN